MSETEDMVGELYQEQNSAYYKAGVAAERERIIDLLIKADTTSLTDAEMGGWFFALRLIGRENKA